MKLQAKKKHKLVHNFIPRTYRYIHVELCEFSNTKERCSESLGSLTHCYPLLDRDSNQVLLSLRSQRTQRILRSSDYQDPIKTQVEDNYCKHSRNVWKQPGDVQRKFMHVPNGQVPSKYDGRAGVEKTKRHRELVEDVQNCVVDLSKYIKPFKLQMLDMGVYRQRPMKPQVVMLPNDPVKLYEHPIKSKKKLLTLTNLSCSK